MLVDDYKSMIASELAPYGLKPAFSHGGKHMRADWCVDGSARFYAFPASPSDAVRGLKNARGDIRKMLRNDGLETKSDEVIPFVTASVFPKGGQALCSSLEIASNFEKPHKDVLRSIDRVMSELGPDFTERNFSPSEYTDKTGRKLRCFDLTRDGFSIVAMGFTGSKAMDWKQKYLEAFGAMEAELSLSSRSVLIDRIQHVESEILAISDLVLEMPTQQIQQRQKKPFIARRSVLRKVFGRAA